MNFLAHFHLAWPERRLIAGGLEGDYHKGPLRGQLDPGIEQGVRLHRAIDAYTDSHIIVEELRRQFPQSLRRYAGILIDISFDHYLTTHWSQYSNVPLNEFNASIYQVLLEQEALLSADCLKMMKRIVDYDVLNRYHDWNAVTATANRVGERFRRGNPLADVQHELEPIRGQLEAGFLAFYPQLLSFSSTHRQQLESENFMPDNAM
jgi:acyl carrier protein phosphodiesterase